MYTYNLGQAFEQIAERCGNRTAIIFDCDGSISFKELNILSNRVANYFRKIGLTQGDVVAIQNNKTSVGFATMIACLKLGITYTNFDYTNPVERIRKIFETAEPKIVFADAEKEEIKVLCNAMAIEYLVAEDLKVKQDIMAQDAAFPKMLLGSVADNTPAYIMFTSGSTGIPKGVVICQKSLLNFIKWGRETYSLTEDDIMTNVNPIYFDNSVFDFYCSVFNGITMVAVSKALVEQPKKMLEAIEKHGCTFWFSVPSMLIYLTNLKLLTKDILTKVRIFSFGGEGYPKELLRKLYAVYGDNARLYNVYGPTEGTCICSAYEITEDDMQQDGLAPLGQLAPNFDYIILDENGVEASLGELCLIGNQLALGYYNDEERTKKSFVKCPAYTKYYERMYKTGDLVEIVDGKLYFRGRVDNQIKHMGYRIELEEIENALIKVEGIKQCAVVHTVSKNNFSKIVAYVAMEGEMDASELRGELKKYLPQYMIPNMFEFMDELPKNVNGKVDRVQLMRKASCGG